jgi:PA14 domain
MLALGFGRLSMRSVWFGLALLLISSQPPVFGQAREPFTLRVTSREVVVEVVARDKDGHPLGDLKESDFQIFEVGGQPKKLLKKISAFRIVDPAVDGSGTDASSGGFHITLGGGCAIKTTFHYQLAFQPSSAGWKSGYHEVLVVTSREHTMLSYRHQYYVGEMSMPGKPRVQNGANANAALQQAACYHSETPASISLMAHLVQTSPTDPLRYQLIVQPDSLAFASISDEVRRVQLDYGVCTFDVEGKALQYMHTSAERVLSSEEYGRVRATGFTNLMELPRQNDPALVRFVVRDRGTGNMGSIDVPTMSAKPVELTKAEMKEAQRWEAKHTTDAAGSLGSIVAKPGAMCGDVFEIRTDTRMLPPNGWSQDAIGSVYTYSLNEPYQFLPYGLPGVTSRPEWFGIDYYGEFWVSEPGEYRFMMTADDGAKLYIDDRLLLDEDGIHSPMKDGHAIRLTAGRHTLHLPYFQGTMHVALVLQVKPPGGIRSAGFWTACWSAISFSRSRDQVGGLHSQVGHSELRSLCEIEDSSNFCG